MVFINHIHPSTEETSYGGENKGDHIHPPTEGKWATSAKNMKLTTFTLVRKTSYGGEMGNHIPLIQRGNGPLLSEM